MSELIRILLVDDECNNYRTDFEQAFNEGFEIVYCETHDEAKAKIDSKIPIDLVILDWFLDESETSFFSKLVLKCLYNRCFIPVFIWSNYINEFNHEKDSGAVQYPSDLIRAITKDGITATILKEKINDWLSSSLTAQISKIYRKSINDNLEKVFFELTDIADDDLAKIIKTLVGSEDNIDWSNDLILNLIHRQLLKDTTFTIQLSKLVSGVQAIIDTGDMAQKRKIVNKALYFCGTSGMIRCGDIIKLEKNGAFLKYGIVVTPDCDIYQNNTRFLEIVELRNINDTDLALSDDQKKHIKFNMYPAYYSFPALCIEDTLDNDFVAIFKAKFAVEAIYEEQTQYPKIPKGKNINYFNKYLYNNETITLSYVCSNSTPYKSDFLHKLHSHNSRVGVPDLLNLLK